MTGRPVTPERQAAEVLARHGIWDAYGGDRVRCYCNRGEHVVVWMNRVAHAEHQTAALAAAGVLRDPDAHEAVEPEPRMNANGATEPSPSQNAHNYANDQIAAVMALAAEWEHRSRGFTGIYADADREYAAEVRAAIDGAAHATGHGRDENSCRRR